MSPFDRVGDEYHAERSTGANDAATIAGTAPDIVTEDVQPTASGVLTASDAHAGEASVQAGSVARNYGRRALASDGKWT